MDVKSHAADAAERVKQGIKTLAEENETILSASMGDDGSANIDEEKKAKFTANLQEMKRLQSDYEAFQQQAGFVELGSSPKAAPPNPARTLALEARGATERRDAPKSLGQMVLDSDAFKSMIKAGRRSMDTPFELKVADLGSLWNPSGGRKDVYSDMDEGPIGSFVQPQRDPMVMRPMRTMRVRDLFPVQTTTSSVIEFFRTLGFVGGDPGGAATVAERRAADGTSPPVGDATDVFGRKPQSRIRFTSAKAPVRTIAHWEAAHRQALSDEPQLRGIIDNELLYGLRLVEDFQILHGDGEGENLEGILETPGIQTYAWSDGETDPVPDNRADALRRAITRALLAYYDPTGIVVHDFDWERIELTKDNDGRYLFAMTINDGGVPRAWRRPIVATPAITEGTALVGAFGLGAQLYDREQANVRVAEQHEDFFVRNAIVVLAEQRLALAVKRPEAFVRVTFDAAPTAA